MRNRVLKAICVLHGLVSDINAAKGEDSPFHVFGILAGGCARDVHFGIEPKDWDIILPRDVSYQQICESLQANGITKHNVYPFYKEGIIDRIKLCVKFDFEGESYDVLVYDVGTATDAINCFDFNLNQFAINPISEDDFIVDYYGETILADGLVPIRGDHSTSRGLKIRSKYAALKEDGKL